MKTAITIGTHLTALLFGVALTLMLTGPKQASQVETSPLKHTSQRTPAETVVTYNEYQGHPVQLVVDHDRPEVRIQVDAGKDSYLGDEKITNWLKGEVERLASSDVTPIELGQSGMKFRFVHGRPIWAPYYSTDGNGGSIHMLQFGDKVAIKDNVIEAAGIEKVVGYYPYSPK